MPKPGEQLRVLFVDDDVAATDLCVGALQRAGYSVMCDIVTTVVAFQERLRTGPYDIVLAEYNLRDGTGLNALAAMRAAGLETPLILVTSALGEERAVDCVKAGVADYVLKHNLLRLVPAVQRALDARGAREERSRSRELMRKVYLAVDQSPGSVIITNTIGIIEYANTRFEQVTGYTPTEVIGKTPQILKSGDTHPAVYREMWQAIQDGNVWRGEIRNRKKNGQRYWDSLSIWPVCDASGVVTHFLATQEEITERRRTERLVREGEELFRQLADTIEEVFFVVDSEYRETLYISPAYERIWGRSCGSLYDNPRSFIDPVALQDRERLLQYIATTGRGIDPGKIEFRVVQPNGETRWVLAHAVPIRNDRGEVYRISGVALDITERLRAQEALADSEARFRDLAEASFDAIEISEGGVVREVNQGFLGIFGYTLDEVIGRSVLDFVADESAEMVWRQVTQGIEGRYELVGKGKAKGGRKIFLEATAKVRHVGDRVERIAAFRDITEKRALEEQFRQSQKMEAVGQLAGGVAHDFNNLLTVITSYASLLEHEMGETDPRRQDLNQILKASSDAASLTRQLLAFSRQQVVEPRLVHLEDVVRGVERMLKHLIAEDVELVSTFSGSPGLISIDPVQLEQVILNLAVNARDAMPQGGRLLVETNTTEFDEGYARTHWPATPGRVAMLAVSDTGTGMSDETRARIFEPFFTTKELGKGTGLGLATIYGIVKQNGGFIWVYSEPRHGTTFKIYLPLADGAAMPGAERPEPKARLGNETVLLVEDAPAVRTAVRYALEQYGYKVIETATPNAAIALIAGGRDPVHLLLTDVVMPGMSGRQLAELVIARRPEVKILYMSGYTNDAVIRHGLLGTGLSYLQKPFTPDTLARKVREVLDAERDDVDSDRA